MSEIDKYKLPAPGGANQSAINYGQGGNKAKPNHSHGQQSVKRNMEGSTGGSGGK